jgi:hypothetical protein
LSHVFTTRHFCSKKPATTTRLVYNNFKTCNCTFASCAEYMDAI